MPNSFENGILARQPLSQGLLQSVRLVGEYRGKEALFKQQSPQVLRALRENALIQSTESSNRIEGVVAPPQRIRDLVAKRTEPTNRSEQESAGYREVLNTIHTSAADMTLTPNLVSQLHRDLFQFVPGAGGRWKHSDNDITETRDGTTTVRFKPLAAHLTPDAWRVSCRYCSCIRLATKWGDTSPLKGAVEETKDGYYDSLRASSQGWHEGRHSLVPWWEYFVGVMLVRAYRDFEDRVGVTNAKRGAKREMIRDAVNRLSNRFRYADLERALPAISRPSIARALRELRDEGTVRCVKPGRDAAWEKTQRTRA